MSDDGTPTESNKLEELLGRIVEMQAQQGEMIAKLAEQRPATPPSAPQTPPVDPTQARIDELLTGLDPDERHAPALKVMGEALRELMSKQSTQARESQATAAALRRFGSGMFEERISQSIDAAMDEHRIPAEIREFVRPHLLKRMHETETPTDPGQHLAPIAEALGTYNARHAEEVLAELRKPKPIAVDGIAIDSPEFTTPKSFDDRVAATAAILEQAQQGGYIPGSQEPS